ncbi:hypothetical protein [Synechococcus sp. M16CYN]|uniref:hypothetical protein n=1 Tax=Synechococcus sp. M16CYN TaxID=3103139 RepID=UPI003342175E
MAVATFGIDTNHARSEVVDCQMLPIKFFWSQSYRTLEDILGLCVRHRVARTFILR